MAWHTAPNIGHGCMRPSRGFLTVLQTIQAGRGLAALAVAAFHLSITMGVGRYGGDAVFEDTTRFGKLGVIFFFVLSGFIILHAHVRDIGAPQAAAALRRYGWRRFVRLYPVYWFYSGAFALLVIAGAGASSPELPHSVAGWINAFSLIRISTEPTPLGVAWTLFHEVMFYAFFAVLIVAPRVGLALFIAWMAACLSAYQYPDGPGRTPWGVLTAAYNLAFPLGMAAYGIYRSGRFSRSALVGGVALVAASVTAAYDGWEHYQLAFAAGCALAIGGVAALEKRHGFTVPAALRLMGDASYTIYLTHLHLQTVALKLMQASGVAKLLGPELTYLVALLACVVGGYAAYRLIEAPLINLCRRLFERQRASAAPVPA